MSLVIDYYLSPQSPWSYLGHARLLAIADAAGARVDPWPIDLGQVFPVSGGVPLARRAPQRQAYRLVDATDLATMLTAARLPAERLPESDSAAVLQRTAAATQRAIDTGVFGAPSYVVDGENFWGQDRLNFLQQRLARG